MPISREIHKLSILFAGSAKSKLAQKALHRTSAFLEKLLGTEGVQDNDRSKSASLRLEYNNVTLGLNVIGLGGDLTGAKSIDDMISHQLRYEGEDLRCIAIEKLSLSKETESTIVVVPLFE